MSTHPPAPESLLADHAFARRLARRLVRDASVADDLAQEAWLRSKDAPPRASLRAWLAGIVRNLARQHRRSEARRARREAAAARPEALPSAAESLERLVAQQDVVQAVLALAEPYRSTVVLRFHDGLPPRAIAARHGLPVATVKTRLARGLAQLRAALAEEHGGEERALALVLAPLARGSSLTTLLGSSMVMNTLLKVSAAAVVAVLGVLWVQREDAPAAAAPAAPGADQAIAELVAATPEHPRVVDPPGGREDVAPAPPIEPPAKLTATVSVVGRVVDVYGKPVAGVELGLRASNGGRMDPEELAGESTFGSLLWSQAFPADAPPIATSAPDGSFALELEDRYYGRVIAVDPAWESVLVPAARHREGRELSLVVAPRMGLTGTVVDGSGQPLPHVEVRFGVPRTRVPAPGVDREDTMAPDWSTVTDDAGRFALERLPAVSGAKLRAQSLRRSCTIEREQWSDDDLWLVIERAPGTGLEGVVEASGAPVAGALVALGSFATVTEADGAFHIPLAGRESEAQLRAAAPGFRLAELHGEPGADGRVRWPEHVTIALSGEPLVLRGVVVDAAGEPLAEQQVWLGAGRSVVQAGGPLLLESAMAGEVGVRLGTRTDANGAFELRGLEDRDYELIVVDDRTALVSRAGPFAAGRSDVRIVQPTDRMWPVVRGVVVSATGEPIEGIQLSVEQDVDIVGVGGSMHYGFNADGGRATTDASGAFELVDVPRGARLTSFSMGFADPSVELTPEIDPLDLRITVDRWVQLEVHAGPEATSFALQDASGEYLDLELAAGGGISFTTSAPLVEGRSGIVKANERGTTLVLYGPGGTELLRAPVTLHADGINRIDL